MPSTGNTFPGTGENNAGIGATAWTSPGNIVSDNATDATCAAAASSQYLVARNYGFSIPAGATIQGVLVRVEASEHSGGTEPLLAQLQDASGTLFGSSKSASNEGNISGTTKAVYTYGSTSDLWGASLSDSICNDADFGVRLWFTTAHEVRIDFVTLAVEYTTSTTHTKAGVAEIGFAGSSVDTIESTKLGAGICGLTGSGADVAEFAEAAAGIVGFEGSGSDVAELSRLGTGITELSAASIDVAEFTKTGLGEMGLTAAGYAGGTSYEKTGAGITEYAGSGVRIIEWTESGVGAIALSAAATNAREITKTGTGASVLVAVGVGAHWLVRTGTGVQGLAGSAFTSERVLLKAGAGVLGTVAASFSGSPPGSLIEALATRSERIGLMPALTRW